SIACTCDKSLISRNAYRQLAAIMPEIAREYKIEKSYRSLRNILFVIISKLTDEKSAVLQVGDIIHIKLILNPFNQHYIFLYNGTKQYESLQKAFSFLIDELETLNREEIVDSNNNHWKIEF
ncbi:21201_t:CDS:2, partial [Racocetra persica]